MKRLLCILLTGLMLFSSWGCITTPPEEDPLTHAASGTLEPIELPYEEPTVTDDPIPDNLIEITEPTTTDVLTTDVSTTDEPTTDVPMPEIGGYDDFMRVVSAVLVDGKGNRNFSPISVYLALAMVTEGARGETQAELLKLLGCETVEQLRGVCAGMLETLSVDEDGSTIDLHNSLWMAQEIGGTPVTFRESFLKELSDTYRSEANTVWFGTSDAVDQISKWIVRCTRGKIKISPDALQFDPGTLAVLINTIYLKDKWSVMFDPLHTESGVFYGVDPETQQPVESDVSYLNRFDRNTTVTQGDGWLRYRVSLCNVGYVVFVLPDEGVSLADLLGSPDAIRKLLTEGINHPFDVSLRIPKFSFQDKMELSDVLKALGLTHCFGNADFSGMSDAPCRFDRVLQESYIGVNEYGVEAAAYTMVSTKNTQFSPVVRDRIDFHLTRPFLYAIESRDGTVLFVGTVTMPTASAQN